MSAPVTIYSTRFCGSCVRAKALLEAKHVPYTEVLVDLDSEKRVEMVQKSGRRTVPQIFIGARHVGGFDDLYALERAGGLEPLLAGRAD
ncbi:MAG TPA: glutaredoxin 3 [Gammaproteobacteria bacterium]|nr:glutaredoxin 3 [Gammaproteobacteria bacterium]